LIRRKGNAIAMLEYITGEVPPFIADIRGLTLSRRPRRVMGRK
jgi:hypothetical protein